MRWLIRICLACSCSKGWRKRWEVDSSASPGIEVLAGIRGQAGVVTGFLWIWCVVQCCFFIRPCNFCCEINNIFVELWICYPFYPLLKLLGLQKHSSADPSDTWVLQNAQGGRTLRKRIRNRHEFVILAKYTNITEFSGNDGMRGQFKLEHTQRYWHIAMPT